MNINMNMGYRINRLKYLVMGIVFFVLGISEGMSQDSSPEGSLTEVTYKIEDYKSKTGARNFWDSFCETNQNVKYVKLSITQVEKTQCGSDPNDSPNELCFNVNVVVSLLGENRNSVSVAIQESIPLNYEHGAAKDGSFLVQISKNKFSVNTKIPSAKVLERFPFKLGLNSTYSPGFTFNSEDLCRLSLGTPSIQVVNGDDFCSDGKKKLTANLVDGKQGDTYQW